MHSRAVQEAERVVVYDFGRTVMRGAGCRMHTRLPSGSTTETYCPTPGISIGSPSTLPPAAVTLFMDSWMSSTAMTTDGHCDDLSSVFWKKPPLMAPGFFGRPLSSVSVVVTTT